MSELSYAHKNKTVLASVGLFWAIAFSLFNYFSLFNQDGIPFYAWWVALFGLCCVFSDNGAHRLRLVISSAVVSGLMMMMGYWSIQLVRSSPEGVCFLVVAAYALLCLQQIYHQCNRFDVDYENYFQSVWNNAPVLVIALFFTGLVWGIVLLWGNLFSLVHIYFFSRIFQNNYFTIFATALFFVCGFSIAYQSERLITTLRSFFLLVCKIVFPLVLLILILCLIPMIVSLTSPLSDYNTYWFVGLIEWLCFIGLIFFNGVYQSGKVYEKLPRWYQLALKWYPLFAFLPCLYMLYYLFGIQHFSISNVLFLIMILILACYALGYFGMKRVGITNIILADVIIAVALVMGNPLSHRHMNIHPASPPVLSASESQRSLFTYRIADAGLAWTPQNKLFNTSFVIVSAEPRFGICRVKMGSKNYLLGYYQDQHCEIADTGRVYDAHKNGQNFDVLTQRSNATYTWKGFYYALDDSQRAYGVRLIENNPNDIICRGIAHNRILLGRVDAVSNCHAFSRNGQLYKIDSYQYLRAEIK